MGSPKQQLKSLLDKWRLIFVAFLIIYAALLLVKLDAMSIQWDEVCHLNGGMLLLQGNFHDYLTYDSFYPPVYDIFTAGFFSISGISALTGRLVSLTFSLLSICVVFEFGRLMYGAKTALVASVFFAVMPGYVWLSRIALIETMLVFFFTLSLLSFYWWLQKKQNKFLILSLTTLVVGVFVKYQMIVAGAIMMIGLVLLGWKSLKKLPRFTIYLLISVAIVVPLLILFYLSASQSFTGWLYALKIGTADKILYGMGLNSAGQLRFPSWYYIGPSWMQTPFFYLFEMTAPYFDVHPISIMLYVFGLAGLVFYAWRRKPADKYLLLLFTIFYVVFTVIPNKDWRYVVPLFPVIALSAACLLSATLNFLKQQWESSHFGIRGKRVLQVTALLIMLTVIMGTVLSVNEAVTWVERDSSLHLPVQEAVNYVGSHLNENESVLVLLSHNLFSAEIVQFYLRSQGKGNAVYQYPDLAADAYTPDFNTTLLINQCRAYNVKYLLMYPNDNVPYFNSTLTATGVYKQLNETGKFDNLPIELNNGTIVSGIVFGENSYKIYAINFFR
jgi:hypothetical protein